MSLYGPTFHVTRVDLCIMFQCNLYICCIMSCGNKNVSNCFKIVSNCFNSDIWGFSAQCLSKLFLKEFTVRLVTTSFGSAFQVVVILIGLKCWATDVLKCFTISFALLFLVLLGRSDTNERVANEDLHRKAGIERES